MRLCGDADADKADTVLQHLTYLSYLSVKGDQ